PNVESVHVAGLRVAVAHQVRGLVDSDLQTSSVDDRLDVGAAGAVAGRVTGQRVARVVEDGVLGQFGGVLDVLREAVHGGRFRVEVRILAGTTAQAHGETDRGQYGEDADARRLTHRYSEIRRCMPSAA